MRRDIARKDFNQVYEIYMDETVNPYVNFEILSKEEFRPIFDEMIESGGLQVYELNGEVIAALIVRRFHYRLKHLAYIGALGIKQQYQGRGFGIKIMQELIRDLRMDGVKRIELRVEADNKRAINFYKKLGFEAEGTHRKYMKRERDADFVDTHLMGLLLEKG
jgi:ribosomal protein S18 acetylase RimI-like enzyme